MVPFGFILVLLGYQIRQVCDTMSLSMFNDGIEDNDDFLGVVQRLLPPNKMADSPVDRCHLLVREQT